VNASTSFERSLSYTETYWWTAAVLAEIRKALEFRSFKEIVPGLISKRYEPGARHSVVVLGNKKLPEIHEQPSANPDTQVTVAGMDPYYAAVSQVVEKQMALEFMDKVYLLAPCLRLVMDGEESSAKHLYNFFQVEIEWRTESMQDVFATGEAVLGEIARGLLFQSGGPQLSALAERNLLSLTRTHYPQITFREALSRIGKDPRVAKDLSAEDDEKLSKQFDTPFWIYDYPEGVRDSIYHKNKTGTYDTYDLMLPFGYGELTTGGIRPKTGQEILEQSQKLGKSFSIGYAEWKERSKIQTAGFGIGLERFLKFVSGAPSVIDFVQYHDDGPNTHLLMAQINKPETQVSYA